MDYIWIAVAFVCGFVVKQINLPPLVGYLAAGFGLHALGVQPESSLQTLGDLGITLLLFTIGLKFNLKSLLKTEIWAGATGHMGAFVLLTSCSCLLLAFLGFKYFDALDWSSAAMIGFAVSFSSTVCAVKVLEERGELRARHGQVAIGILVIQDIAAVVFVSLASDKSPSLWAFALLALPLARPLLSKILERSGHGEVLLLAGFFLALTGGELFELVGLKAYLGALVVGMLLSSDSKAVELSKSLLGFKDIFLIAFFLSIGFTALPTFDMWVAALIMVVALPLKTGLLFLWLTRLKLRSRSSFLAALGLSNYSEFGLIVCAAGVTHGIFAEEWLVIMALAVALSFVFSSIINISAHSMYARWCELIKRFEHSDRLLEDQYTQPTGATVLVIGMGRVGTAAYDTLCGEVCDDLRKGVYGVDVDKTRVTSHLDAGRNVILADAEDPDFWSHIKLDTVELVLLAMPAHLDILEAVKLLKQVKFQGKTAGIARHQDEMAKLLAAGIDETFNYYTEVGVGFAEQSLRLIESK
ncbi:MAG: cation:proton antiporter [Pseudomonadales bacterium]|nr:cation:proton antiporter [Pseudomonadales bacterium]